MNKKATLIVLTLSILVAGCTATQSTATPTPTQIPTPQSKQSVDAKVEANLKEMLAKNNNICTFTYTQDEVNTTGTIYIANRQMKGETTASVSDKQYAGNFLIKDDTMYSWSSQQKQGIKISFADIEKMSQESDLPQEDTNIQSLDQKYEYDCKNWTYDAAKFELPKDMTFIDMAKQLQSIQKIQQEAKTDNCGICEKLPADQKQQCKQALSCQ